MDMTIFPALNRAIILYLIIILVIAIYYVSSRIDLSSFAGTGNTIIPIALLFLLITNGFFMGNNGLTGDFGLEYCNDADTFDTSYLSYIEETEQEIIHPESFFACELGYIDGTVDLGWTLHGERVGIISWQVMILNHDNYKKFVNGETYGFSNFHLSELQASITDVSTQEEGKYVAGITLHSDTYFFVVDSGYEGNRGLIGPNSPTGSSNHDVYFHYTVDLDYDTSGVITTN